MIDKKTTKVGRPKNTLDTPLKDQQLAYASFRLQGMTQAGAARAAGYKDTKKTPWVLERDPRIQKLMRDRRNELCEKFKIDEETVLQEVAKVAFSNVGDLIEVHEDGTASWNFAAMTPAQRAAISKFSVDKYKEGRGGEAKNVIKMNVSSHDKLRALEFLGKHLNLFRDTVELDASSKLIEALKSGRERALRRNKDDE